ncbi:hypothetical protein WA026_002308 [Henosepilachna vigintioctopunctata]|uniref:Uncharacterized protein n=1 Tax=Henosepilachna vigintioctopunctata TaxID=420089 RepID=A0AAW1TR03_9CUCU
MKNSFDNCNIFLIISLAVFLKSVKCYTFEHYDPTIDTEQIEEPKPPSSPIPIDIKRLPVNPDAISPFVHRKKDNYDGSKSESFSFERLKQRLEIDPIERYKSSTPIPIEIKRQPVQDIFLRPCSYGKKDIYRNQGYRRLRRRIGLNPRKNRESVKFPSNSRRSAKNFERPRLKPMRWNA